MDRQELIGELSAKWGRQLVPYTRPEDEYPIYCAYADEALTGFVVITDPPKMGEFRGEKAILLPLSSWIMLTTLAGQTVTPSRLVAVGKKASKVAAWRPHSGLKYAVRHTEYGAMLHIPVSEFKEV